MYSATELIKQVREIVKLRPDVVYTKTEMYCSYLTGETSDGKSSGCLFGLAMRNMGIDIDSLKTANHSDPENSSIATILNYNFEYTVDEGNWCDYVQGAQDDRMTWGQAVRNADKDLCPLI